MPQSGLIYRLLIASPSDCNQERKIIPEEINNWNAVNSRQLSAIIEPVMWETHTRPDLSDRPQEIINRQIVDDCDLLVGAFWTRLGTPTGEADSGTVEEIEIFLSNGKPVMLYFSSIPVVPDNLDRGQYDALIEYRRQLEERGLISSYESYADFRGQFQRNLSSQMIELVNSSSVVSDTLVNDEQSEDQEFIKFRSALENFVRRLIIEWDSERDSDPPGIGDGKLIIEQAHEQVLSFRSMNIPDQLVEEGVFDTLDDVYRRLRILSRHQVYMDGGVSFQQFWEDGNDIIADLNSLDLHLKNLEEG